MPTLHFFSNNVIVFCDPIGNIFNHFLFYQAVLYCTCADGEQRYDLINILLILYCPISRLGMCGVDEGFFFFPVVEHPSLADTPFLGVVSQVGIALVYDL